MQDAMHGTDFHRHVADRRVHRTLMAYARRRLPRDAAEDAVQQALCDAVAAERKPEGRDALDRWLMTIVKHKVCDWFRARTLGNEVREGATRPEDAIHARDLLARIATQTPENDQRTLSWLIREHDGESLEQIAAQEQASPPAVRQRIHRYRRLLRASFAAAAALTLCLVAGSWFSRPSPSIGPDVAGMPATPITAVTGTYRIDDMVFAGDVPLADRVALERARESSVRIENGAVIVEGPVSYTLQVGKSLEHGQVQLTAHGHTYAVRIVREADGALDVTSADGPFRGQLRLRPR